MRWRELTEARSVVTGPWPGKETRIWINPSLSEIQALAARHSLRGITDGANLYVWDARKLIHGFAADGLITAGYWVGGTEERPKGGLGAKFPDHHRLFFFHDNFADYDPQTWEYEWQMQAGDEAWKQDWKNGVKAYYRLADDLYATLNTHELANLIDIPALARVLRNAEMTKAPVRGTEASG